jgi:hypothetical protein
VAAVVGYEAGGKELVGRAAIISIISTTHASAKAVSLM